MSTASKPQIIITILYPRNQTSNFDMNYYLSHHISLTHSLWDKHGMLSCIVCKADENSSYAVKVVTTWKDMIGWNAAQEDEETKKIMEDVKNFTNVESEVIIGKIVG